MGALTKAELERYTTAPSFTDPVISTRAARRSVPDDVWRSLEMVPGLLTWGTLVGTVVLSFLAPAFVAYAILFFDVYWLLKSVSMAHSLVRAYRYLKRDRRIQWNDRLRFLSRSVDTYEVGLERAIASVSGGRKGFDLWRWNVSRLFRDPQLQQEYRQLRDELKDVRRQQVSEQEFIPAEDIYHLIFVATYTEELDTLRPSFQAIADSDYDHDRLIVVLATEGRDAKRARENAAVLQREFGKSFRKLIVTEHPDGIVGEVKGKGSNISWAGRHAIKEIDKLKIPYGHVLVTTLDADHRPHPQYFAALTYSYMLSPQREQVTFQPTPLFHNNLWDTTAPNRVIATSSSFWHMVESTRSYRLRNFAAHSQSLPAILATDYWSVDTIVEDGQQYWRSYFRFHGEHFVVPIYVPIYQDAVLSDTTWHTWRAQYLQLRRWAWGASDFPYIVVNMLRDKKIPLLNKLTQMTRFTEGHITWAIAPILITFVGFLPNLLSPEFHKSLLGQTLAPTASAVLTLATIGLVVTILMSLLLLPEKPAHYRKRRRWVMIFQWFWMPVTTLVFSAAPAIESQTRLMLGKYLEFRVTEKSVRKLPAERRAES